MWNRLSNSSPYYLLFTNGDRIDIAITNFVKVWTAQFSKQEFIYLLKETNFALEIDPNEICSNGLQMLSEPGNFKSINIASDVQHLIISASRNFGYPLKLLLKLKIGSNDEFFQVVTQPLLKTVQDLRSSETELRNLLKCKDKEIEEYKAEAGEICLRYLKTKPFNDQAHMEKHTMYDINFGSTDFSNINIEDMVTSSENTVIKQESVPIQTIKTEPATQEVQMEMQVIQDNIKVESIKRETCVAPKKRKIKLNL